MTAGGRAAQPDQAQQVDEPRRPSQCTAETCLGLGRVWLPRTSSALNQKIDLVPPRLVSSRSYVCAICFRSCRPTFLLSDPGRSAIGDPRSPPPDQCAAEVAAWACSPEDSGPSPLDVAYAPLARLALCPRHRQAGDGDRLASQGIPAVLDLEEPPRAAWKTGVGERDSRAHSQDESGEPTLGSTSNPWGTAQTGIRGAANWLHPAGVLGPHHRPECDLPAVDSQVVFRILSACAHASGVE
jgi:hypothetical protein